MLPAALLDQRTSERIPKSFSIGNRNPRKPESHGGEGSGRPRRCSHAYIGRTSDISQPNAISELVAKLPSEKQVEAKKLLKEFQDAREENPLLFLEPHHGQRTFMTALTRIIAAFAGNRFGKTTSLLTVALREVCDRAVLPEWLQAVKRYDPAERPVHGRIVVPDFGTLETVLIPAFRAWAPPTQLFGGRFDKAWDKQLRMLRFQNGSWIEFMTYKQDLDQFGGAPLHFCGFDEPPPADIFRECEMRTADFGGFLMFAMTPLMGIGWVFREIWMCREDPEITCVRGSIHENPHIRQDAVDQILSRYHPDDPERRSREFGDFKHFGGMVYPGGFEPVLVPPPTPRTLRGYDVVVGIDPGVVNAAVVWVVFDDENRAVAFEEVLIQDGTAKDYAHAIRERNKAWQLEEPLYVIDPKSAEARSLTGAKQSVRQELEREGIYPMLGANAVEAGIQHIRRRMQYGKFFVADTCHGLQAEADQYRIEDRPDEKFAVVKENDHRLDALRYAVNARPWDPIEEVERPQNILGATPAWSDRPTRIRKAKDYPPTGAMT